ncbi:hypothetical protein J6TS7_54550 [Paenibacillus dendritiformis]|nr:hypothetical protein J6TS7_54550 [Paenibacillus dendritiformis]
MKKFISTLCVILILFNIILDYVCLLNLREYATLGFLKLLPEAG